MDNNATGKKTLTWLDQAKTARFRKSSDFNPKKSKHELTDGEEPPKKNQKNTKNLDKKERDTRLDCLDPHLESLPKEGLKVMVKEHCSILLSSATYCKYKIDNLQ